MWNNASNPNSQSTDRFLAGLGAGLIYEPLDGLQMKLDYGIPLINLSDRGTNAQDDGFYFSVNYRY